MCFRTNVCSSCALVIFSGIPDSLVSVDPGPLTLKPIYANVMNIFHNS